MKIKIEKNQKAMMNFDHIKFKKYTYEFNSIGMSNILVSINRIFIISISIIIATILLLPIVVLLLTFRVRQKYNYFVRLLSF